MGKKTVMAALLVAWSWTGSAQEKAELLPYGDMDRWIVRKVTESGLIGGNTKLLYEVGPTDTIVGSTPYTNQGGSPWATSNVMAKVGVTKTNTSVFQEKRDNGYCARMETRIETCVVLGLVNIKVLAAGSMFLGTVYEPIKSTSNPQSKLGSGIPFTKKPAALRFDYKVKLSGEKDRIRLTGFSKSSKVEGMDLPEVNLFLQKRWEDAEGNVYAKRIGTVVVRYDKDTGWVNGATYKILYGDITSHPGFKPYMGLITNEEDFRYTQNSRKESVPVKEVGWGSSDDEVTHAILQFTSSHGGAYIGSPGNTFWVDNVQFVYE
ncbi:MAG: PCMD domain-containing protein [Parabacteroides sp.]|nr:PCMD domain-containing protein [Parabacteroides sp.]